jgi:hypothetical protein
MCGFSEWKFINLCWSVGMGFGHSNKFFIRLVVHWVEFSAISWSHCVGVGASVISIA